MPQALVLSVNQKVVNCAKADSLNWKVTALSDKGTAMADEIEI